MSKGEGAGEKGRARKRGSTAAGAGSRKGREKENVRG
jgi:hypothetical protein